MEISAYAQCNNGYKYLLTGMVDFSRYDWVVPTKTKSSKDVTNAMNSAIKEGHVPQNFTIVNSRLLGNIMVLLCTIP